MIHSTTYLNQFYVDRHQDKKRLFYYLLFFIIYPFATFLAALFTYRNKNSQIVLILFTGLFGYAMIAENESLDLYRVLEMPAYYGKFKLEDVFSGFLHYMFNIEIQNSTNKILPEISDVYISTFAIMVSAFTKNGHILVFVFGLIYGYLFINTMRKFIEHQPLESTYSHIPIIFAAFMMPISQLAGVRYGTATYLFVWGVLGMIQYKKTSYLLLISLAAFVHFSFVIPSLLLLVYITFVNKIRSNFIGGFVVLYILSFFVPNLLLNLVNSFDLTFLGLGAEKIISGYTDADINRQMSLDSLQNASWIIQIPFKLMNWFVYGVLFLRVIPYTKFYHSSYLDKIYVLALLFLILSNISLGVSNLGTRLLMVSSIFVFYYLLLLYKENMQNNYLKYTFYLALIMGSLRIILELRFILGYLSPTFFYGSIYHILTDDSKVSLATILFN